MKPTAPTQQDDKGAPAALRWLADREQAGRLNVEKLETSYNEALALELEAPPEMDGVDFLARSKAIKNHLDAAVQDHLKLAKALREFDKSVDISKRDSSEAITREDGERVFSMASIYMNQAAENYLTRVIPSIREARSDQDAFEIAGKVLKESITNAFTAAVSEGQLPPWALKSVEEIL